MKQDRAETAAALQAGAGSSALARTLGSACLGAAMLALLAAHRQHPPTPGLRLSRARPMQRAGRPAPARALHGAAALLALSVLADSAIEHYRGRFENPGMFAPLATSLATVLAGVRGARAAAAPASAPARAGADGLVYATAFAVGAAGSGFHAYNVGRRPGGFCWQNLFYAAPLGAPAALALAGLFGLAARRVAAGARTLLGWPTGRVLAALTGVGIAGTSAEAALLHFRGAYHRAPMWLPVTLPPVAAVLLLRAAGGGSVRAARAWLGVTALLGAAGVAFHASGIRRQMGGWSNWRQNLLSGPPLPAPPSFAALALAGRAALALEAGPPSIGSRP
jgi:hypothetical protein